MKSQKIIEVKISDLKQMPGNPRKISEQEMNKLKKSIQEFGYVDLIVVDEYNTVIGGNQRLQALQQIDIQVPIKAVQLTGYSDSEKKALNIALNKISGEWNLEKLDEWIEELKLDDYNIDLTGYEAEEIKDLKIPEFNEKEEDLKSYNKIHILISYDIDKHEEIIKQIANIENMEGVEIEKSEN